MRDTPTIASSSYASTAHDLSTANFLGGVGVAGGWPAQVQTNIAVAKVSRAAKKILTEFDDEDDDLVKLQQNQFKQETSMAVTRRLVKVVIIDPNENIPLDQCVLHSGEEKLTDATDQELFFEVDIKKLLDDHNAKRIKLIDKKVKERTEHLEPAKIRDLKMVVVNIAQF
jgi:hypothetical protein